MKIRTRLVKGESARFLSHLDLQRTLERTLRRAAMPLAMSQGFNPHPRISFAGALAVGITSEAEFIDVDLTEAMEPELFVRRANPCFPSGLSVAEARVVADNAPTLFSLIDTARLRLVVSLSPLPPAAELRSGLDRFLALDSVLVEKESKGQTKLVNIRPQVYELNPEGADAGAITLLALVQSGTAGNLRPDDLVTGLAAAAPGWAGARPQRAHRLAVYRREGERLVSPWDL